MLQMRTAMTLLAAVTLATLTTAGRAEAQRFNPLTSFVDEAIERNLALEAERSSARRAAAEVRGARGLFLPSLGLDARYSRLGGVPNVGDLVNPAYAALNQLTGTNSFPTDLDITFPQRHETRFRLVQPLFNEGIRASYAAARANRDGQRSQLGTSARELAALVQTAYLQDASARRVVEIYQATLTLLQEHERVSERLLAAGRATPEAVFRARAERSDVEQRLLEAREQRLAASRAFNRILQRPLEEPVPVFADSIFEFPLDLTADEAVRRALAAREELGQVDAGLRQASAARRAATASYLPSLSLAVDYGFQGRDLRFGAEDDFWMASLVVSWSLFNGGRDAARREAAGHEAARATTLRRDLESGIVLEVRTAHEAAVVARNAIATAEARTEAARRTFALVRRRYEEGVATPIEFVDARASLTNAELNRVLTTYRYAIRWVALERAAALRDLPNIEGVRP